MLYLFITSYSVLQMAKPPFRCIWWLLCVCVSLPCIQLLISHKEELVKAVFSQFPSHMSELCALTDRTHLLRGLDKLHRTAPIQPEMLIHLLIISLGGRVTVAKREIMA